MHRIGLFFVVFLLGQNCWAQVEGSFFWGAFVAEKRFKNGFESSLDLEARTDRNGMRRLTEIASGKSFGNFKGDFSYRFTIPSNGTFSHRFRTNWKYGIELSKKWEAEYRLGYQIEKDQGTNDWNEQFLRNRLKAEYRIAKKWRLSSTGEIWYDTLDRKNWDQYRLGLQLEMRPSKMHRISLQGLYEKEMSRRNLNEDFTIVALEYKIVF